MLKILTHPTLEPVTLAEAKLHMRVDYPEDDSLITSLITAARELCEGWVSRSFITTAWRLTLERVPGVRDWSEEIKLPRASVLTVTSMSYVDTIGASLVLDPSFYQVELGAPGKVAPAYGLSWPSTRTQFAAVTIDFTAGYGAAASTVPEYIKSAIKLLAADLYENRENSAPVKLAEAPWCVQRLLALAAWSEGYA